MRTGQTDICLSCSSVSLEKFQGSVDPLPSLGRENQRDVSGSQEYVVTIPSRQYSYIYLRSLRGEYSK